MIFIPILGLFIGVVIGLIVNHSFTGELGQYLAVSCLAALDSICGGVRAGYEGKFHTDIFLTGFVTNVIIATVLAWLGDRIYIDLYLAVSLVLGWRIFTNLSLIRRLIMNDWKDARERKRMLRAAEAVQSGDPGSPISAASDATAPGTIQN